MFTELNQLYYGGRISLSIFRLNATFTGKKTKKFYNKLLNATKVTHIKLYN